jgi:hypothetical protein
MSIIKKTIKFNNLDVNIKLPLGTDIGITGYQQEIDNITVNTENELINPVVDSEVRRFKYDPTIQPCLINFYYHSSNVDKCLFISAGFTQEEIDTLNVNLLNSFFILDYYDSYDTNTQSKIFTTYLTKVLSGNYKTPSYPIKPANQLYYLYVPQWYIDIILAEGNVAAVGYIKFSFYIAKYGGVNLFYNHDNIALTTPEKMYFKTILNLTNMTWRIYTTSFPNINAYELYNASAYTKKVNDTISNFNNKKQNPPIGNTFQSDTGTYIIE